MKKELLQKILWWVIWFILIALMGYLIYFLSSINVYKALVIFFSLNYGINLIIFITVLLQKRNIHAKISWFVVMSLLPVIGHTLFVIFARRYHKRKSFLKHFKKHYFKYEEIDKNIKKYSSGNSKCLDILKKQSLISKRAISRGDFEIFFSGVEGFKEMFADMKKAKKFIHTEFFILRGGELFEEWKSILIDRANHGVKVRMLIDDFGSWELPRKELREILKHKNIEIKFFGKIPFPLMSSQNVVRLHRKMVIIDGTIAHSGGMNIADEYSWFNKHYGVWIDLAFRIRGKSIKSLSLLFLDDWYRASGKKLDIKDYLLESDEGQSYSVLVDDTPEINETLFKSSLVNWILNAKKKIVLVTPYFIPSIALHEALKTAAMSGVKIEIIIPGRADWKSVIVGTRYYAKELKKYGIKFFETQNVFVHSKIGIFDDKYAFLGTSNLDMRSFYHQLEMVYLVEGPITEEIINLVKKYKLMTRELIIPKVYNNKFFYKLIGIYVKVFTPIM